MSTVSLSEMVTTLRFWGRVQQSEGFLDPSDFETIVLDAVKQHNSSYVVTSTSSTFPAGESLPLRFLILENLALLRATKLAQQATVKNDSFANTDSPYEKMLKLAKQMRERYETTCRQLGLTTFSGGGQVRVSEFGSLNASLGATTPLELATEPPFVQLEATYIGSGCAILKFTNPPFSQFVARRIFTLEGNDAIFQEWNTTSSVGTPRINNSAIKLFETGDRTLNSIKVVLGNATSGVCHRFLVVTLTVSGIYGYSNEVLLYVP